MPSVSLEEVWAIHEPRGGWETLAGDPGSERLRLATLVFELDLAWGCGVPDELYASAVLVAPDPVSRPR